ncbi:putative phosphoglycerate mutase [Maritalea mobilis]|uniref:Putative phosphoglycerate mutase n=1 Tax=Maritalea mobilis TaxID=483324 RepID=A0A4V3DA48_9HYPH|nr:histidine phosphatase family protein [Maritalea mobilis]TDQ60468.1 putative phosphoglycerate mutase [Maritalea mobilis]
MSMILPKRTFCLIRHGETVANRDGLIAGHWDVELTVQGLAEAKMLRQFQWPSQLVLYASPLKRAMQTAQLGFLDHEPILDIKLKERDWGALEGQDLSQLCPRQHTPPKGESWADFVERKQCALTKILLRSSPGLPVIVAHSGTIRAVRFLLGLDFDGPRPANGQPIFYSPDGQQNWREYRLTRSTNISALMTENQKEEMWTA